MYVYVYVCVCVCMYMNEKIDGRLPLVYSLRY